jgi:hypothetical protein
MHKSLLSEEITILQQQHSVNIYCLYSVLSTNFSPFWGLKTMTKICIVKQTDKEKACLLIGKVGNKAVQR